MTEKFEQWAIIELFGHQRIAGKISNQELGGETFIRVDVPETSSSKPFTKMYGKGAIYAITITDELTAKAAAEQFRPVPFDTYSIQKMLDQFKTQALPEPDQYNEDPDFDPDPETEMISDDPNSEGDIVF